MSDFATRRTMMVDTQVRPSDVTKYPIIDAMLSVPRENFVPTGLRETAYMGENIDLDGGRVVLEPRTLAKMLDALDIGPDELVLDVACGYGYSSAVIARMAQAVVALEEDENMAREAQEALMDAGADNVVVHEGRLTEGAQEHGPYDVLVVQGAVAQLPDALISQLKDGGRAAALFMDGALGEVRVGYKMDGRMTWRAAFNAGAPILPGFEKHHKFEL
ncbi:MAG: protein-L-isoaspartate O-methyltransferase [Paracoccaceae bacterium]